MKQSSDSFSLNNFTSEITCHSLSQLGVCLIIFVYFGREVYNIHAVKEQTICLSVAKYPSSSALRYAERPFNGSITFHSWTKKVMLKYGCGWTSRQNWCLFWSFSCHFLSTYLEPKWCKISFSPSIYAQYFISKKDW